MGYLRARRAYLPTHFRSDGEASRGYLPTHFSLSIPTHIQKRQPDPNLGKIGAKGNVLEYITAVIEKISGSRSHSECLEHLNNMCGICVVEPEVASFLAQKKGKFLRKVYFCVLV